jgi:hypothetical protein
VGSNCLIILIFKYNNNTKAQNARSARLFPTGRTQKTLGPTVITLGAFRCKGIEYEFSRPDRVMLPEDYGGLIFLAPATPIAQRHNIQVPFEVEILRSPAAKRVAAVEERVLLKVMSEIEQEYSRSL